MFAFVVRVVILGILAALTGGQKLQMRPDLVSPTKAIGNAMLLTCEAKNVSDDDQIHIKWLDNKKQEILSKNGRLYVEDDGLISKLYITSIQAEDAGKYSCQARIGGIDEEKSVSIEIFRDITFENFPLEQHPKIYTDALISCLVTGQPVPAVSWRSKGNRLRGERYSVTDDGLRIRNITESDNGNYTCRGELEYDGRYNERTISVTVHIPPTIIKAPGDVEAKQGDQVSLACEADGLPKPEYKFYKDGGDVPLKSSENIEISETNGSIRFISLVKLDEGSYTCNATNSVGYNTSVGKVKVLVKPTIAQFDDVVGVQDKEVNITCISEGDPPPTLTIHKEGTTKVYQIGSNDEERVTVSSSKPGQLQLTIRNLTIEDAGRYICRALNKVDSIDGNAAVTVHFMPRFTEETKEIYNWAGKVRNLTCEPMGEPAPSVEWVHEHNVLANDNNFRIYKSERSSILQVTINEGNQSWIYGDYFCRARNDYGEAESKIEMKKATAPDMPRNVSIVERTPTTVMLEVSPPVDNGGVTISGYSVEYKEKIQDLIPLVDEGSAEANETEVQATTYVMVSEEIESTGSNIFVKNLKADTTYTFKVRAKNEVGLGSPYEFSAITDAFRKPQPLVIKSNNVSKHPSEYTVTWESPKTGGKPIQRYKFSIRKMLFDKETQKAEEAEDSRWSEQTVEDNSSSILSHTLKDLSPSTHYQLKICAANEIGWSEPTKEFTFSTSKDPNASPTSTPEEESTAGPVVAMATDGGDGDEEGGEESQDVEASSQQAQAGTGLVVGIVLAVFIVFLIIVDVSCYFLNNCGLTMFLCGKLCKKESHYAKEKAMEEGESNEVAKQPLPDDENAAAAEKNEGEEVPDQLTSDQDSHHDKKPLLDSDGTKEINEEHLNKPTAPEEKDEELKEPLKDEILLEHPKVIKNEEADLMKKPEVTAIV